MFQYAIVNDSTGLVENIIIWDGVSDWSAPDGFEVVQSDVAGIGWSYGDKQFVAPDLPPLPIPTAEEILAVNTGARDSLLTRAALAIAPLQDAVDLAIATTDEVARLTAWKQYRVNVSRIDLTQAEPAWPAHP